MDSFSSSECDPNDLIEYKPCITDNEAEESGDPQDVEQSETDELQCKICGESVPTMAQLIVHFLLRHEATGNASIQAVTRRQAKAMPHVRQKYLCGLCGIECFDTMRETRRHMFEEHGYQEPNSRDSGADYSSEESTDTDESERLSDNDSIDGVSSGMLSGMSSSTQYVSSPDSRRTRRRSYSYSSSEYEPERAGTLRKRFGSPPNPSPELGASKKDKFEDYLRSVTLKSLIEKFKSEMHHKCSRKGCQYKFTTGGVRERHLQCHLDDNELELSGSGKRKRFGFKCTQCDHRFDSWKPCMLHLWHQHQIDLGMLQCPLCEKRFGYVVHVFNHLQTHRPKSMREIECRICGQRFANTAQRSVHEALHRKKGHHAPLEVVKEEEIPDEPRAPVPSWKTNVSVTKSKPKLARKSQSHSGRRCKLCKRMFSNAKILSKHVKTVHFKIKPFICNVCGYKCARKVTLTIHMRQHSGVKPLACQSCSFRTADPSALYYHERRHREEKTYKCRICGLTTVQPSALKRHIQSHHPQEYERIKCRLCSFASINAQNLRRHQADHEAGLIVSNETERRETDALAAMGTSRTMSGAVRTELKNVPDVSLDCFLPPESADSVVHDAGGITIPAIDGPVSVAHSEDTQFPL
uniref:C2H2-type domain-containing protein n=1 Tax=Anopheles atroparvus TaxID=41427 RepID=A0AAG5DBI1_ANOAO